MDQTLTTRRKNEGGFTLVEMLIVLAIMAILIGLAIPVFKNVLDQSKMKADKSTAGMLESTLEVYYTDEGSYPGGDFDDMVRELNAKGYIKNSEIKPQDQNGRFVYDSTNGNIAYTNANEKND